MATAPPPIMAVRFNTFLNAMVPVGVRGKCSEETETAGLYGSDRTGDHVRKDGGWEDPKCLGDEDV